MKPTEKTIEFKFIHNYKVTHHIGSELIEIQELVHKKTLFVDKYVWKRIYFGHSNPIQFAIDFYNKSKKEESNL